MEPDQERVARIMELTGTTEEEARAFYHLEAARKLLVAIHRSEPDIVAAAAIDTAIRMLTGMIAERVLERHYPEGWALRSRAEGEDT